jgi:WD40 repeat protein/serine/threonine protein kinase
MRTSCPDRDELQRFLGGQLGSIDDTDLSDHIGTCATCQQALQQLTDPAPGDLFCHLTNREPMLDPVHGGGPPPATFLASTARLPPSPPMARFAPNRPGATPALPAVPGYEVLSEVGRGGMGVIYRARHLKLNRTVALKMISAGGAAGPHALARFRIEAATVARLRHPNIVSVYDVGEVDGQPYMSLEFAEGGSLKDHLNGASMSPTQAAQLLETLARAIDHAHHAGIVHRDLKPANVLLVSGGAAKGTTGSEDSTRGKGSEDSTCGSTTHHSPFTTYHPKITDFGLAKLLDGGAELKTQTGEVVGTPSYMAPEQTGRSDVEAGPSCDVYALGAILYEMLTGRPPFNAQTPLQTLLQVAYVEPVSVSRLQPTAPRDLVTITMKCLEKEPQRRYGSALELADDLRRFLDRRPIRARPVSSWEHLRKWARRHPAVALLSAAVVLVTVLGVGLATWQWRDAVASAEKEKTARHEVERLLCSSEVDVAIALCERGDVGEGMLRLARELKNAVRLREADLERVIRVNLTAWRQEVPLRLAYFPNKDWAWDVALSPDGRTALVGGSDNMALMWDTLSGRFLGQPMQHPGPVWSVAFAPDGCTLLTACSKGDKEKMDSTGGELRLWNARTGEPLGPALPVAAGLQSASFNCDGQRVLLRSVLPQPDPNQTAIVVQLFELAATEAGTPALRPSHTLPDAMANVAQFSPDGKAVLTGGMDGRVRLWNARDGRRIGGVLRLRGAVLAAGFRGDSRTIVTSHAKVIDDKRLQASSSELRLWDITTSKALSPAVSLPGMVNALALSPDGSVVLSAATILASESNLDKGEVRLWEAATGDLLYPPLPHPEPVWAVAFSPNGRTFLTGCRDRHARLWLTATGLPMGPPMPHEGNVRSLTFSRDGRLFLTGSASDRGRAQLWVAPAASAIGMPLLPAPVAGSSRPSDMREWYRGVAASPDGKYLISSADRGARPLRLWDARSRKELGELGPFESWPVGVAISPDSRLVAVSTHSGHVQLASLLTRQTVGPHLNPKATITSLTFSPDGRSLLTPLASGTLQRWDVSSGARLGEPLHPGCQCATAWSPYGDRIIATGPEGVSIWDAPSGKCLAQHQEGDNLTALVIAPDGLTFATGHSNRSVRFWRTDDAHLTGRHLPHKDAVVALAFSSDGRLLVSGSNDLTTRLWDVTTGMPLGPPLLHRKAVTGVCFLSHGRQFVTRSGSAMQFWEVPAEWSGEPAQVRQEVEALTGRELDATGMPHTLSPEARQQRRLESEAAGS